MNDEDLPPLVNLEIYSRDSSKRWQGKHKFDRQELKSQDERDPSQEETQPPASFSSAWCFLEDSSQFTKEKQANGRSIFRRHSSALKPTLTVKNKLERIDYALSQINSATINTRGPMKFQDLGGCCSWG
jgi:hypothetical protein